MFKKPDNFMDYFPENDENKFASNLFRVDPDKYYAKVNQSQEENKLVAPTKMS